MDSIESVVGKRKPSGGIQTSAATVEIRMEIPQKS